MTDYNPKVILMGLDNAGKTSILLSLKGEYDPSKVKPTLGVERSEMEINGQTIIRWDFGGQERYRETYFEERSRYLDETDLLFFVVDIADGNRFLESVLYYVNIIQHLEETGPLPPIALLLHKADPEFMDTMNCRVAIEYLANKFKDRSSNFDIQIFTTSIFNRESLVTAFSRGLAKIVPK